MDNNEEVVAIIGGEVTTWIDPAWAEALSGNNLVIERDAEGHEVVRFVIQDPTWRVRHAFTVSHDDAEQRRVPYAHLVEPEPDSE